MTVPIRRFPFARAAALALLLALALCVTAAHSNPPRMTAARATRARANDERRTTNDE